MALAIIIPLSMLIYSNSRITELKETLRAEMGQMRSELTLTMEQRFTAVDARFNALEAKMDARFSSIDRKLDEILRILGDHETRITKLEHPPR
jgi:hypothetical protein